MKSFDERGGDGWVLSNPLNLIWGAPFALFLLMTLAVSCFVQWDFQGEDFGYHSQGQFGLYDRSLKSDVRTLVRTLNNQGVIGEQPLVHAEYERTNQYDDRRCILTWKARNGEDVVAAFEPGMVRLKRGYPTTVRFHFELAQVRSGTSKWIPMRDIIPAVDAATITVDPKRYDELVKAAS